MVFECPGAQKFRKPQPEFIKCPFCGAEVEIWTDEVKATCPNCKKIVTRQQDLSCVDWCKYAKECLGDEKFTNYMKNKVITIKERLVKELEDYFGSDIKRINHAKKVMAFAEELLREEKADWHIVIPASILHDVGIKVAEVKYGSSAGDYQEKEDIEEICEIIAHHHSPGIVNTRNFKVLYDADWLVNFAESSYYKEYVSASRSDTSESDYIREKDEIDTKDRTKLKVTIDKVFLTDSGKILAEKIYLSTSGKEDRP